MSDGIVLNPGVGGSTVATYDISGTTPPTTGQVQAICLYVTAASGTVPALATKANPIFMQGTDGTNVMPSMDAAARPGFQKITDGTNTMPSMDAAARPGFVKVTDGTNLQPTLDVIARAGFVQITDGTRSALIVTPNAALAENAAKWIQTATLMNALDTGAAAGSQAVQCLVESTAHPNFRVGLFNGATQMPAMAAAATAGFVKVTDGTNTQPTGDAVARGIFIKPTDGTNTAAYTGVGEALTSSGGKQTTAVAAAAAASAIKASAGRLCRVLVTTAGTAALNFFDNATTNSGTIIGTVTASAVAGTVFDFGMPAANGIWCASGTNTPAVTISWI